MQTLAMESQWLTPVERSTLYVCKSYGDGILVLNGRDCGARQNQSMVAWDN
jgi:hypothetical protein